MKALPVILFGLIAFVASAQTDPQVDISEFTRETQQWSKTENNNTLVWWIPFEYWRIATRGNAAVTEEGIKQIEDAFSPYVLVCAADLKTSTLGTFSPADEADVRSRLSIIDKNGKKYTPLEEDEVSSEAWTLAGYMKPVLGQALGQIGKGMHFFFFKVQDDKGENLIQATKDGSFTVKLDGRNDFKWTLPVPTLLPPKYCPVDKEKMKGHWKFCPHHGNKLN